MGIRRGGRLPLGLRDAVAKGTIATKEILVILAAGEPAIRPADAAAMGVVDMAAMENGIVLGQRRFQSVIDKNLRGIFSHPNIRIFRFGLSRQFRLARLALRSLPLPMCAGISAPLDRPPTKVGIRQVSYSKSQPRTMIGRH